MPSRPCFSSTARASSAIDSLGNLPGGKWTMRWAPWPAARIDKHVANSDYYDPLMHLILVRHGQPDWQIPRCISLSEFRQRAIAYDATHLSPPGSVAIRSLAARLPE